MKYKPYAHWTRAEFKTHFDKQVKAFTNSIVPEWLNTIVQEAVKSLEWSPSEDFNGCSFVEDRFHPCLACFIHDFLWHTGRGGRIADAIFFELMLLDGSTKFKAYWRWLGVRCTWFGYYKWKYLAQRNLNPFTDGMICFRKNRV